jgi:ABC-type nickel/cobalt efflux system permease component RcnA
MTRRRVPILRLLAAMSVAGLAGLVPAAASAHPLGNFSINHYAAIRVSVAEVRVDLVIDLAEVPALEAITRLDTDGDGRTVTDELDAGRAASCADLLGLVSLTAGSRPVSLSLEGAGLHVADGAGGLDTLRIVCQLRGALPGDLAAGTEVTFSDGSYAERIGWREVVVLGDGVSVASADGDDPGVDVSNRLTRYPTDLLQQPLAERSVTVAVRPGGPALDAWSAPDAWPLGSAAPAPGTAGLVPGGVPGGVGQELAGLVDVEHLTLPLALLGLLVAGIAGAGHALSPGHGKTVMAAYLVGSQGGVREAILLGAAVTVSHTLGVLLLAAVVLVAGSALPPERLYPVLTVASGAMVAGIGLWLLAGCVRRARRSRSFRDHAHDHDSAHSHAHDSGHGHAHDSGHGHAHDSAHGHAHPQPVERLPGWRGLAAIGVAGGLVPSTAALILLLGAIGAGQPAYGLALALAFGAGMAAVLTGIGLALVHGRAVAARLGPSVPGARRMATAIPWVTAVVILVGGVVLTSTTLATTL